MKRRDLLNLTNQIKLLRDVKSTKLAYNLMQNLHLINKIGQPSTIIQSKIDKLTATKIQEFNTKRIDLCHDHAKIDDKGNPIIIRVNDVDQYDIKDKPAFESDLKKLREEYKDIFNEQKELYTQLAELLNEEIEVEIIKVSVQDLPKDLSLLDLEKIKDLLEL